MKLSFTSIALWLGLVLFAPLAQADAHGSAATLLILEVSPEDASAARLLSDLMPQPSQRLLLAEAREPARAAEALHQSAAGRAAVLDTLLRTVRVIERDGSTRTRQIDGPPTPYVIAFVASELLALDTGSPAPPPPAPAPAPRNAFRFDGTLSFDAARTYTTAWVARPKLALGVWLSNRPKPRALTLIGVELAGPSRTQRDVGSGGRVSVTRLDMALRLGAALPFGRVRWLTFARGTLASQQVDLPGLASEHMRTSLGLGVGTVLEVGLTRWLGLCAGLDLGAQLRRHQLTFQGQLALREHLLWLSASLGLVLSTPWQ
jgi:hypothetical protein